MCMSGSAENCEVEKIPGCGWQTHRHDRSQGVEDVEDEHAVSEDRCMMHHQAGNGAS